MDNIPVLEINQPAPQFQLPDLEGEEHALVDYRGRIVIINFWSAECPWSEQVDRRLLEFVTPLENEVALVSIASNANEGLELLSTSAAARVLPLVLIDSGYRVADRYGAQTTPHFFVLDRDGNLRYQGAFDDVTFRNRIPRLQFLNAAVEALLAGKQPDPSMTKPYGCALVRFAP
jgi:peroxiredoxin